MKHEGKWSDLKEIKKAGVGIGPHTEVWDEYATQGMENVINEYFVDPFYEKTVEHFPHVLYLGLNNPHYPYFAQEDLFNYYLDKVPLYKNEQAFDHPWLGKSPFMPGAVKIGPDGDVTEKEARRATAAYYANIEECDKRFGRVLKKLEDAGENLDEWIIIYTTDHGEMLGEHSIWEKQKFFEASARVPLIIRWTKGFKGGEVVDENVNLCDLFATLCDLCDIPVPEGLDSRSLVPLINGNSDSWNNESVSQFKGTNLMIKWDDLKYQYYGEDMPEVLFDLKRNPQETKNFIDDPKYVEIVKKFRKRRGELAFGPNADPNYKNAGY